MKIPRKPWIYPESPNIQALMIDIMNAKVPEILVSGPRNCGKSWIIAQCELTLAEMYPGIQILNLRHEMSAMGALLSQWDNDILKYGLDDKRNPFTFHSSTKEEPRTHIKCSNGSKILFAGMDKPNKALGAAIDFAFYNELQLEWNPEHWSAILGAMEGGRAGNWPGGKHLAIADMNPTHKRFWAYLRANPEDETEVPAMKHYRVRHIDHPHFYVWSKERWTHKGKNTVDGLDRAYTVNTFDWLRNVKGEFCNAEGAVYSMFDLKRNVQPMQRQDFTEGGKFGVPKWRMSVDFGSGSINALGLIAYSPQDKTHRAFKEIYKSEIQVSELIRISDKMLHDYQVPKSEIEICYADHQTECWKQMRDAGYPVKLADKDVIAGVETCKRVIADGRWIVNSDSLYEPDMKIAIRRYIHEVLGYAYKNDKNKNGSINDDKPEKKDDHAMDWKRYYLHGEEGNPIKLPDMFSVF